MGGSGMYSVSINKEAFECEEQRRSLEGLSPWNSLIIHLISNSSGIPPEEFEQTEKTALFNFCVNLPAAAILLNERALQEDSSIEENWAREAMISALLIRLALHPLRLAYEESQEFQECLAAFTRRSTAPEWLVGLLLSFYQNIRTVLIAMAHHAWEDKHLTITSDYFDGIDEWVSNQELGSFINTKPLKSAVSVLLHEFTLLSRLSKDANSGIAPFPAPSGPNPSSDEALKCVRSFLVQAGVIRESPQLLIEGSLVPGDFGQAINPLLASKKPVLIDSIYSIEGQKKLLFCVEQEDSLSMLLAQQVKKANPEIKLVALMFPVL
jgi:hypothetical protein